MKLPQIKKTGYDPLKLEALCRFLLAGFCFAPALVNAQEILRDPTRPPAILSAPQERETINVGPVLQSVSFASGRRSAIISGQHVTTGSKIGEARVVSIIETEVLLKTGDSLQRLKLFPDVEKHSVMKIRHYKH